MATNVEDTIIFLIGLYLALPVKFNYIHHFIDVLANPAYASTSFIELAPFLKFFVSFAGIFLIVIAVSSFIRKFRDNTLFDFSAKK